MPILQLTCFGLVDVIATEYGSFPDYPEEALIASAACAVEAHARLKPMLTKIKEASSQNEWTLQPYGPTSHRT